jgi:thiol:disulfide interchange protein
VVARLVADRQAVAPGETVRVGLHLEQQAGWHTYWKSPGEIGLPTDITWTFPAGWSAAGPYVYPVPHRFEMDDLVSYGYDDQVLLYVDVPVPADATPGPVEVSATATWLVCKSTCIPGETAVKLPLTVAAASVASVQSGAFDAWKARHPLAPAAVPGLSVDGIVDHEVIGPNAPFKALFDVKVAGKKLKVSGVKDQPTFIPAVGFDWNLKSVAVTEVGEGLQVLVRAETYGPEPLPAKDEVGGLLQVEIDGKSVATEFAIPLVWGPAPKAGAAERFVAAEAAAAPKTESAGGAKSAESDEVVVPAAALPVSGPVAVVMALIGGLILNVMPCVLPVLMLKLYGLVEQANVTRREQIVMASSYGAGVLLSFWGIAASAAALRAILGTQISWGMQFQYPEYVAGLATVVFAFGLSLLGVFELPAIGADSAARASDQEGPVGMFFSGVFAVAVATPCTAPFMGPALGFAMGAPIPWMFAVFTALAVGMAAPFLLVAAFPALYKLLPAPGPWMETFKQVLGFTLIATTVWLVDVLVAQIGPDRTVGFLVFLVFVAIGAWVFGKWGGLAESGTRQLGALAAGGLIATLGGCLVLDLKMDETPVCDDGAVAADLDFATAIPWQPFSEKRLEGLADKPVFIDFTAEWCLSCKANEKAVLETATVRQSMKELGVVPLKADWTRKDPVISAWLTRHGRAGVPMYLVIPADRSRQAQVLPELLTTGIVVDAMRLASAK